MKITFVLPFASLSGGIKVVAIYARKLAERGHDVHVVSQPLAQVPAWRWYLDWLKGKNRFKRRRALTTPLLDFLGDRHIVLDSPRPVTARDLPDADAIVASWWETAEWVAALPPEKGRGFYLLQDYEMFGHLPQERVAATYALPLKKIAVSHYIRDTVARRHGAGDIDLLPNAVDLEHFATPPRAKNTPLTVGFLFAENTRKNTDLAIAAIRQAKQRLPELRVKSFGATRPKTGSDMPDWVEFHVQPAQGDIPGLYASCDLWLFTSKEEGFGLPLLEAMASRTPVLATRAGAAPDLVTGQNGILLEDDAAAFVDAIVTFHEMTDPEWQACSEAAHRTAHAYSWDDATERLLTLFEGR